MKLQRHIGMVYSLLLLYLIFMRKALDLQIDLDQCNGLLSGSQVRRFWREKSSLPWANTDA
jgi:hypothetical protein